MKIINNRELNVKFANNLLFIFIFTDLYINILRSKDWQLFVKNAIMDFIKNILIGFKQLIFIKLLI